MSYQCQVKHTSFLEKMYFKKDRSNIQVHKMFIKTQQKILKLLVL